MFCISHACGFFMKAARDRNVILIHRLAILEVFKNDLEFLEVGWVKADFEIVGLEADFEIVEWFNAVL